MFKRKFAFDLFTAVILFLIPLTATWNVIFSHSTFAGNDIIDQFLPWRFFLTEYIKNNHKIPLWNPYTFCGTPFLGNVQNGIFYPFTYLMLLNKFLFFKFLYLINCFIFFFGLYYLLQLFNINRPFALFSVLLFESQVSMWTGSLSIVQSVAWIPFCILFFIKSISGKYMFLPLTSLSFFLAFTGGYPQILFVTLIACFTIMIYEMFINLKSRRKNILTILFVSTCSILLFIILSAVQLFPAIEFYLNSNRVLSPEDITGTALKEISNLFLQLFIFLPGLFSKTIFFNSYLAGNSAEIIIILSLMYSIFSDKMKDLQKRGLLLLLFLIGFSLSLGELNPLNRILFLLPGFSLFRHSGIYMVLCFIAYIIVGLYGFSKLISAPKSTKFFITISAFFLILIYSILYALSRKGAFEKILFATYITNTLIICVLFFLANFERLKKPVFLILAVFILSDQISFLHGTSIPADYYIQIEQKRRIFSYLMEKIKEPSRILFQKDITSPNENMIYGLETIDGYDPIIVKYYVGFLKDAGILTIGAGNFAYFRFQDYHSRIADILNVGFVVSSQPINDKKLNVITELNGVYLYRNLSAYPRAYLAKHIEYADKKTIAKKMLETDYIQEKLVFMEEPLNANDSLVKNSSGEDFSSIRFVEYTTDKVTIRITSNYSGFLVLNDTYYPGWKAYDNGKRIEISRANYFMRAIKLSPGEHEVVFEYDPWTYRVGKGLSIFGVILVIFGWINFKTRWWLPAWM